MKINCVWVVETFEKNRWVAEPNESYPSKKKGVLELRTFRQCTPGSKLD